MIESSSKTKPVAARSTFLKRLTAIPELDGDSFENLKKFIEKVDTLYASAINEIETNELYEQMILKINGEARDLIFNLDDVGWSNIKSKLYEHFSHLCNKSLLTTQLENLKQGKEETLAEYAERARKLLNKKNAMYNKLSPDQKSEYSRMAYKAFNRGIKNDLLRERALTRGASSLEDAIESILDMENDSRNEIPKSELFCRACKMVGHREIDCRRKASDDPILNFVNALRNVGPLNLRRDNANPIQRNMNNIPSRTPNYRYNQTTPNRSNYPNPLYNYPSRINNNDYQNQNRYNTYQNPPNNNGYQNRNQMNNNYSNQYNRNTNQTNQTNPNRNSQYNNNNRRNMNSANNAAINRRVARMRESEN